VEIWVGFVFWNEMLKLYKSTIDYNLLQVREFKQCLNNLVWVFLGQGVFYFLEVLLLAFWLWTLNFLQCFANKSRLPWPRKCFGWLFRKAFQNKIWSITHSTLHGMAIMLVLLNKLNSNLYIWMSCCGSITSVWWSMYQVLVIYSLDHNIVGNVKH